MSAPAARDALSAVTALPPRRAANLPLMQRQGFRVLQTSRAPAQLSLFQRPNGR